MASNLSLSLAVFCVPGVLLTADLAGASAAGVPGQIEIDNIIHAAKFSQFRFLHNACIYFTGASLNQYKVGSGAHQGEGGMNGNEAKPSLNHHEQYQP